MRTQSTSDNSTNRKTGHALYVSSSRGRAGNDGRAADAPLASLRDAVALVNEGRAERLLLRRGDVFSEPIGRWKRSGRSAASPALIGAYGPGDQRPVIRCNGSALELVPGDAGELHHVMVIGLHFIAAGRDPDEPGYRRFARAATGICVRGLGVRRVMIEDCRVEQFDDDVLLDGVRDVTLRRCVLLDVESAAGAPAHQIAVYGCRGSVRIDACVFDQNTAAVGASHHHVFAPHGNHHVAVTGCVVARSPGTALLVDATRNVVAGNTLVGNRLHVAVGGSVGTVTGNLILGGRDRPASEEPLRRTGAPPHAIWATAENLRIERNVVAHRRRAKTAAIVLAGKRREEQPERRAGRARIVENVVFRCGGGIEIGGGAPRRSVELLRNDLQRLAAGQPAVSVKDALINLVAQNNRYATLAGDAAVCFPLGNEQLTFAEWTRRMGDTSVVLRTDATTRAPRLPRRFVADARAQSGDAWRAHLAPAHLIRRFFRAFDLPRQPETPS